MERKYKDSGIEWIGKIPETWEVCKLNYIYRFQTGATPPSKVELYFDGDIKWANISDLKSQYVYDTKQKALAVLISLYHIFYFYAIFF